MAGKKPVHVVPHDDGWAVKREGSQRASSVHKTQGEADQAGRATAKQDQTQYYLHNRQGQIRDERSYGNDPYPPPG
jgi:hypothetical protein